MEEKLLRLCIKEFSSYEEGEGANPWKSGDKIMYRSRSSFRIDNDGLQREWTQAYLQLIEKEDGRRIWCWIPTDPEDLEIVNTVKKIIREV